MGNDQLSDIRRRDAQQKGDETPARKSARRPREFGFFALSPFLFPTTRIQSSS